MTALEVQFLTFDGCPLAEAARGKLEEALAACDMNYYEEVDILDSDVSDELRGWGSPTILINGADVMGQSQGDGVGCRVYSTPDRVPDSALIAARLNEVLANGRA